MRESMESPGTRLQREMAKLVEDRNDALLLRHAQFGVNDLLGAAFTSRYDIAEEQLRRVVGEGHATREQVLAKSLERAVAAMRHDPFAELLRNKATPWYESLTELQRAVADVAAEWSTDDVASAATLEAYSDVVEDLDDDIIEVTAEGEILVTGETVPSTVLREALTATTEVVRTVPTTQKALAPAIETTLKPRFPARVIGVVQTIVWSLVANGIYDAGKSYVVNTPAPPPAVKATGHPAKLYRVTATSLSLRAEPSTDAEIRTMLRQGEQVLVVEHGSDGWVLVRTGIVESSFEQGWVWIEHLDPIK